MMLAIKKEPGREPKIVKIENTLKALQDAVGGYIETVTIAEDAVIICNEEGRIMGLKENCNLCGVNFVGTILAVGTHGEDFGDLSHSAIHLLINALKEAD